LRRMRQMGMPPLDGASGARVYASRRGSSTRIHNGYSQRE
jgi:hypothetical protein